MEAILTSTFDMAKTSAEADMCDKKSVMTFLAETAPRKLIEPTSK
jgi:hypothetical protein